MRQWLNLTFLGPVFCNMFIGIVQDLRVKKKVDGLKLSLIHIFRRFLLTPLREGRLINLRDLAVHHVISTHAPAGGATVVAAVAAVRIRISTHAPAGGATRSARTLSPKRANFYSRPCGRGDRSARTLSPKRANFYSRPCGRGD